MRLMVFLCLACLGLMIAGCGGANEAGVDTVPVSGTVYLDGKPAAGVQVDFVTDNFAGFGRTDAEGKFKLVQGAVAGPNRIFFSQAAAEGISEDPESGMDQGQMEASTEAQRMDPTARRKPAPKRMPAIPARYSDFTKPEVTFMVPPKGTKAAEFQLTSK